MFNMSKSLAQIIPKVSKTILSSSQQKQAVLWENWSSIIGEELQNVTPLRVTKVPGGTLVVQCHLKESMRVQYQIPLILERIQHFCGIGFITKIRIEQNYDTSIDKKNVDRKTISMSDIKDNSTDRLDDALARLGRCLK